MACDALGTHHKLRSRVIMNDGTEYKIRWYPCRPGAKGLGLWSAFISPVWEDLPDKFEGVGCKLHPLEWAPRRYPAPPGIHYHGEPEWFATGIPPDQVGHGSEDPSCMVPLIDPEGGDEDGQTNPMRGDAPEDTTEFFDKVHFWNEVTIDGKVFIGPGGLCLPVNPVCGPLDWIPDCAYVEYNSCEGAIRVWDTASQQLLCFPGTACNFLPDGIDTGAGATDAGTCDCDECPQGAVGAFAFEMHDFDDPTYAGLSGRWKVTYTSGCQWVATDADGNQWVFDRSGGFATLTGTTVGGDTCVYDCHITCCDQTDGALAMSSTGNLHVPHKVLLQPIGNCPDCPEPPPPPDGPGTCRCPACPDPPGAPRTYHFGFVALGDFAPLAAADWNLDYAGDQPNDYEDCVWATQPQTYPWWILVHDEINHCWWINGLVSGTIWVRYKASEADFLCCAETVFHLDDKRGRGVVPDALTIDALTGCDCGGGGSVSVPCYPTPVKKQLVLTIMGTGASGFDGDYPIAWDDVAQRWQYITTGPIGTCPGSSTPLVYFSLRCMTPGNAWVFEHSLTGAPVDFSPTSESSSGPLVLVFSGLGDAVCSAPVGWSWTITEKV